MRYLLSLALICFLSIPAYAEKVETLQGKAFKDSSLVYTEDHTSRFSDQGRVLAASTIYKDPSGKAIAEIRSDFSKSLSAPAHDFKDLRFKQRYGIRYEGDKMIMYVQEGDESEQTKAVSVDDKRALLVGCQGLAYYFRDNLEDLKKSKIVPILFLIPGKLETYNFELVYKNTDANGLAIFEIHIKNWLLRLFAPKLTLHYDTSKGRLVKYDGLSNLYDDKKQMQNVQIDYVYPN